jgi:hypothetical protein
VVAPVKDQEGCGSCWAYATTSAAESLYAIKTGKLTVMSEQAPNDCNWMSNPCVGGNMEEGYKWLTANGLVSSPLRWSSCCVRNQVFAVCATALYASRLVAYRPCSPLHAVAHTLLPFAVAQLNSYRSFSHNEFMRMQNEHCR